MERMELKVNLRDQTGKGAARKIRALGLIPGIVYGIGQEALPVTVDNKELLKAVSSAGGLNAILDLSVGGKEKVPVMLKDYQADVISRKFLHVDFLKIDLSKKVTIEVPIHLVGKAPGTKEGGILEHITRTIKVICLPTAIPDFLEVDVSTLQIGDNLHVRDVKLPEGLDLVPGVDQTIAAVIMPAAEEEKPVVAEGEIAQPEVIGEKKAAEGEESAAKEGKDVKGGAAKPKEEKKEKKDKK
jgi:large subunit ribosomal protein L25